MAMPYFPVVQVLTLLQAIFNTPPQKKKKSLRVYTGCPCYAETRWELGGCFVYHMASNVGGVASRNRDRLIPKPLVF